MTDTITLTKEALDLIKEVAYQRGYVAGLKAAHGGKTKSQSSLEIKKGDEKIKFRGTTAENVK